MTVPDYPDNQSALLCLFPFQDTGRHLIHYVHDVSGSVLNFARIAGQLAEDHDVVGFQCLGLDSDFPADQTIEQMAERYADILIEQGTAQPYDLIGYSMGGLVAFEMAVRLLDRGATVRRLGLIDPTVPGSISNDVSAATIVKSLARSVGVPSIAEVESEDPDELLTLLVAAAEAAGILPASYTVEDLRPTVELRLTNARAASQYRPAQVLPMDIRLLAAGRAGLPAQVRGWASLTSGRVHDTVIEADHVSLVSEANAAAVAEVIRGWTV